MMSEEQDEVSVSNATYFKRQLVEDILLKISATEVQNREATKILIEGLQAYNFSLSPNEVRKSCWMFCCDLSDD